MKLEELKQNDFIWLSGNNFLIIENITIENKKINISFSEKTLKGLDFDAFKDVYRNNQYILVNRKDLIES
jgi:hypothetical protein